MKLSNKLSSIIMFFANKLEAGNLISAKDNKCQGKAQRIESQGQKGGMRKDKK